MIGALLSSLRVRRWVKNLPFFAALLFSHNATSVETWMPSLLGFALLCLAASGNYLVDDVCDRSSDRAHPEKRGRAIAEGRLSPGVALAAAVVLLIGSVGGAAAVDAWFGATIAAFAALGLAYSLGLKRVAIVDLFLLAFRFLARIVAGAVLLRVEMSRWFLLCGLLLSLFIALSNRRHGIVTRKERGDGDDELYSTTVIDQMVAVVTSATLVAYGLYTLSAQTVEKFGSGALTYTIPFVLYGIFRFLYLIYQKDTTRSPEKEILLDRPLMVNVVGYLVVVVWILYFD